MYSLRGHTDADGCASGGSISWPARNGGKNRAKGVPPLQFSHAKDKRYWIERSTAGSVCGRLATGSLAAAFGVQAVSFPRSGCRRRRAGRHSLSVLPETGRRPTHSRSRSQAATTDDLSSVRRRTKSRHAGGIPKGRALRRVFCPAFSARAEKGWPSETKPNTSTNSNLHIYCLWFVSSSLSSSLL